MVKRIFLVFSMALSGFLSADGLNAINDPVMNPCIQRPDLAGCGANGSVATQRVYKVPNRWGAIYYNPANDAVGYSENNTEGYRSANKEALANCINAGGGQNPLHRDGKGCRKMTEVRNACSAIVVAVKAIVQKVMIIWRKQNGKLLTGVANIPMIVKSFILAALVIPITVID